MLLSACIGLDSMKKDADPGRNLDSADTGGDPLETAVDGNTAPIADAGDDASGTVARVTDLDGSGSSDPDMDALTYLWELTEAPASSSAGLINETRVNAELVPDVAGRYVATLTVSDGAFEDSDEVEITVTSENSGPVANAGSDQTVTTGDTVSVNGSGSSDPEGDTLAFVWTLSSRPGGSVAALSAPSTPNPTFVADVVGNYELSLTVSDGTGYSAPDTIRVRAADASSGGSTSACGCSAAPEGLSGGLLLGVLVVPALLRRRRARERA
jgi:MYXO-CTERM domain-containing protein